MYRTRSINQRILSHTWLDCRDKHREFLTFRTSVRAVVVLVLEEEAVVVVAFLPLLPADRFHWWEWRCPVPASVWETTSFRLLEFHQLNTLCSIRVHHEMLFLNPRYTVWNSQLIDNILSSFLVNRRCSTGEKTLLGQRLNASRKNGNDFSNARDVPSVLKRMRAQTTLTENSLEAEREWRWECRGEDETYLSNFASKF